MDILNSTAAPHYERDEAKAERERQRWFDGHVKTFEHIWAVWPFVEGVPDTFLRLTKIGQIVTCDPLYYSAGHLRANEKHCLFHYTLSGRGFFRDATGEHLIEPGHGFLCEINDPATSYYYGPNYAEPWIFLAVSLEGEAAHVMTRELIRTRGPVLKVPLGAPIWHQLQSLKLGQYNTPHVSPMTAVELAAMFLVVLAGCGECPSDEPADLMVKKALHRLSLPTPLPEVNELANSLHISREHFSRVFRQQVGVAPQTYINQERINRACRLLCATDFSNKQIASQLGYAGTSSFLRAFRRAMNLSPQQFRQNAQDSNA